MKKKCTRCGIEKHEDEFRKAKGYKNGIYSQCKLCEKEKLEEWRKANPDKFKAQQKRTDRNKNNEKAARYRETHREKVNEAAKERRKENSGKEKPEIKELKCTSCGHTKEASKHFFKDKSTATGYKFICKDCYKDTDYYKNRKKTNNRTPASRESKNKWKKRNPEKVRQDTRDRRLFRRVGRDKEALEYAKVLRNDPCSYCGKPGPSTVDHIIPVSKGGTNDISNLTAACADCNSLKHNKDVLTFMLQRVTDR